MLEILQSFILFVINFPSEFLNWLGNLSAMDLLAITWFAIVIDISRNVFKAIVLGADAICRHFRPVIVNKSYQPKISVLIPAHNEAPAIRKTIVSILENPYPNK